MNTFILKTIASENKRSGLVIHERNNSQLTCFNKVSFFPRKDISTIINDTSPGTTKLIFAFVVSKANTDRSEKRSRRFPLHCETEVVSPGIPIESSFVAHSREILEDCVTFDNSHSLLREPLEGAEWQESKFKLQSKINYKINNKGHRVCCNESED